MSTELPLVALNVIAARCGERLRAGGQTVAVAESSAGGLVSAALLAIPESIACFSRQTPVLPTTSQILDAIFPPQEDRPA